MAVIRQEKNGGAWCPKAQISSEIREYLEVDLVRDHLITWTETQGRFGNGQGQEYAEAFLIEYWRHSLNRWIPYKDAKQRQVSATWQQTDCDNRGRRA
ncbi:hypothetical protein RUM44_010144 [Polyplax serrata]|uniref:F5/8 type C domain-containing protein n=1 Tax=Polyplax serrata TaxID=468196 RepID=A0ABR1AUR3_POLSC